MTHFNQAQHVAMLAEMSMVAGQVGELARMIQEKAGANVEADVLSSSVEVMAQRIGWLTVIARQGHTGDVLGGAVADELIFSALFFELVRCDWS